ncbi:hypothetical protein NXY56_005373 [Leishmania guyanensis]
MLSSLLLFRSTLEDLSVVPAPAGVAAPAERWVAKDSQTSEGETDRVLRTSRAVHFPAPDSSSNGETLVHTSDACCDTTVDESEFGESYPPEQRLYDVRTSIELSTLPEQSVLKGMTGDVSAPASAPAGTNHREEDDEGETGSLTASPVPGAWRHHPCFHSTSTDKNNSMAVLSDAAALMIAHAVHRSSLLQQCFTQWQAQQARHAQRCLHRERFAEGYYQRNLLYLFFRAWQWRHARRIEFARQRRALESLRARHLRCRSFVAWQRWKNERKQLRGRVDELQVKTGMAFTRQCFGRWHRTSTRRALARAAAQVSADILRDARFCRWRCFALQRKQERLFVNVLMIHTPNAWGTTQKSSFGELHLRYAWIQWLRVTMLRRACQLHRYESAVSTVMVRAQQALQRRGYVRWLQLTYASLQVRYTQRGLLQRYYKSWALLGRLSQTGLRWERESRSPQVQRGCLAQWRDRLGGRQANCWRLRRAEFFFESVVQVHIVHAAFHCWHARHSSLSKTQRMRRVAEEYARPALLRHLFLRHVTDGVLASPLGLEDALKCEGRHQRADTRLVQPVNNVTVSSESGTGEASTKTSGGTSQRLRPPIPLFHHRHASPGNPSVPAAWPDVSSEPNRRTDRSEGAVTARMVAASVPEDVLDTEALLLPPPSYEEVMSSWRAMDTSGRIGSRALPARTDVGVGTSCEVPAPVQCATPPTNSASGRLTAHPDVAHQREGFAPPLVSTVPGRGTSPAGAPSACPAAAPCYFAPKGSPVSWTLGLLPTMSGWPTLGTLAPPSEAVISLAGAIAACERVYCAPPTSDVVPAVIEPPPACAVFSHVRTEGDAQASAVEYGPRAPATLPSPAVSLLSEGLLPAPLSPQTHYGVDIHSHVDRPSPSTRLSSSAARADDLGCVKSSDTRGHRSHKAQRRCVGPPAAALDKAILSHGRVPLSFAGRRTGNEKRRVVPSPDLKETRGAQSAHFISSSSSSLRSSHSPPTSAAPRASDAVPFPLCPTFTTTDSATLRARGRSVLGDYKRRTRLIAAEKAELVTIESQLALASPTKDSASQKELSKRRRYLQQRLLEWEQRRAQVAQLAVWLEGCVSAATSAAASQGDIGEL